MAKFIVTLEFEIDSALSPQELADDLKNVETLEGHPIDVNSIVVEETEYKEIDILSL